LRKTLVKTLLSLAVFCFYLSVGAQNLSLRSYVGKEISGNLVHADITIGVAFRYELSDWLYIEPFLRVGHGSLLFGEVYPRYPENYAGKLQDYVLEQTVKHDEIESGLSRYILDSDLLTVIHGYQLGAQKEIGTFNGYIGAGVSIGYMDYQTIIEAGDAIFDANGQQYLLWYSIPTFQRGLGLQMSLSTGVEKQWKDWSLGVRGDVDFSPFGFIGLGQRMSVSLSVGILL
jgi:hypothetical protein